MINDSLVFFKDLIVLGPCAGAIRAKSSIILPQYRKI